MIKQLTRYTTLALLLLLGRVVLAQDSLVNALKQQLAIAKTDTSRVNKLVKLSEAIADDNHVVALQYADQALKLAQKINDASRIANAQLALGRAYSGLDNYEKSDQNLTAAADRFNKLGDSLGLARALSHLGWVNTQRGDYAAAFALGQESLRLAQRYKDQPLIRRNLAHLGALHIVLGDYTLALDYMTTAMDEFDQANDLKNVCRTLNTLGELYRMQGNLEKAAEFYDKSISMAEALNKPQLKAQAESNLAAVQTQQGQHQQAIVTARRSLQELLSRGEFEVISWVQTVMARAQLGANRPDSAILYGQRSWNLSRQIGYKEVIRDASSVLAQAYARQNDFRKAYQFQQTFMAYNDSLSGSQTRQQLTILQQSAKASEEQAAAALQAEEDRRQRQWLLGALVGLGLLGVVAVVLWRSNQRQTKTNTQLRQQQSELKAAQNQLVQQEKLASLGELTAGIAHEIQNPLNFVNNFAEVSIELVNELKEEGRKGEARDAGLETELLDDLEQNMQKITHHGQRASGIVRSMLAHSRKGTDQKELTDLTALADEYLRLAYHGLRAKSKTFNAELKTDFAPKLPKIPVVSQDIGRVLLNLFNNGFYATQQRVKNNDLQGIKDYQPTITVSTRLLNSTSANRSEGASSITRSNGLGENGIIEIRVRDNGMGMPDAVKAKIFQPFFTTKPTGEGTGLGLSLSYDIITKGHGGTITVESVEGEGTEFIVTLPA